MPGGRHRTWGLSSRETCWRQKEPSCLFLGLPVCLLVLSGLVAPLENVTLSPPGCWWKAERGAKSLEDFAVLLPSSRRRFRARRAAAWLSAPRALPAGSKGLADGLHCERESVQGSVSRETSSARKRGGARLLSDSREMLLAEPWGTWPLAHGSRRCWTGRTGCVGAWWAPCVARGHVSTALAQLRWDGAVSRAGRGLDVARQLQSREVPAPEVGGGMDTDKRCLQTAVWGRYSSAHACYLGWGRNCQ